VATGKGNAVDAAVDSGIEKGESNCYGEANEEGPKDDFQRERTIEYSPPAIDDVSQHL
jgi:hypothetical protein